jgi:hypothetical protein
MVSSKNGPSRDRACRRSPAPETAAGDQPFHRELAAGDVAFHLQMLFADLADPPECRLEFVAIVGADHAAAGREPQRLEHAGILRALRQRRRIAIQRRAKEPRRAHAGRLVKLARQELIAAGARRRRRMKRQPNISAATAAASAGPSPTAATPSKCKSRRASMVERHAMVEFHRQSAIAPGIVHAQQRSVASATSIPKRAPALANSRIWYPVVAAKRRSRLPTVSSRAFVS